MLGKAATVALALLLAAPTAAFAGDWRLDDRGSTPRRHHDDIDRSQWMFSRDARSTDRWARDDDRDRWDDDSGSDSSVDDGGDQPAAGGGTGVVVTGEQKTITVRTTGFSWFDNSPPSSATVCCGTWHKEASGTGTREDPITVAVPGSGGSGMEFPAGTLFYSSSLKRYLGVEDSGASKFDQPHLDIWVGGQGFDRDSSDRCMQEITGTQQVTIHPPPGLPVNAGPLTGPDGCSI